MLVPPRSSSSSRLLPNLIMLIEKHRKNRKHSAYSLLIPQGNKNLKMNETAAEEKKIHP